MKTSRAYNICALALFFSAGILEVDGKSGFNLVLIALLAMILSNQYASEERWSEVVNILNKQSGKKP